MATDIGNELDTDLILRRYARAKSRRDVWQPLWRDCYHYALPQRENFSGIGSGMRKTDHIFDSTAMDGVEQLAASLLGNLTPPWSNWFGFKPGPDLSAEEAEALSPALENAARIMQAHFDRSNFAVEMHQAFLDLVTGGTATLHFEESKLGDYTAFRFQAVPLSQSIMEENPRTGRLESMYRDIPMTAAMLRSRFDETYLPVSVMGRLDKNPDATIPVLEAVYPDGLVWRYVVMMNHDSHPVILSQGHLETSPFISFRWMKSPGEIYGRSPIMKSLPDIKTVNKVVELILKNASIAVSGIWQADDDGVLNPDNVELTPGTIIPRAMNSRGLTPLEMPGQFDVSQLVLDDLRSRIRHGLLVDRLGQIGSARMTATEVLERSSEMALLLGATYGRLQSELLTPLIHRAYAILRRRGEVPDLDIDGRLVTLDYRSPIALAQGQKNVENILYWMNTATARHLGEVLGVPADLIRKELPSLPLNETIAQ